MVMDDQTLHRSPAAAEELLQAARDAGFDMASEPRTGSLLATLAASKPKGRLLELGTGTGVGTAWLLSGMGSTATLDSVDNDPAVLSLAQRHLGHDRRTRFHLTDAAAFLGQCEPLTYDLIYADTWAGKFTHLDLALSLLTPGGIYVVDDLLPQASWPAGHAERVPPLVADLESRRDFVMTRLSWASGLIVMVRTS